MTITPKPDSTATILIVDDRPENLQVLSTTLNQHGYDVRGVISGAMALRAAQAHPPDLILLDIRMPDLDGYDVCRRLKASEQTRHIPVIFLSALGQSLDKVQAFAVGGADYITKPFQVDEVLARVKAHLAAHRTQQTIQQLNAELERRIQAHTAALAAANQSLQREIEERQRVMQELQAAHQRLTFHIENTPLGVIEWTPAGHIIHWSRHAETIFGWPEAEVKGHRWDQWPFVVDDDYAMVRAQWQTLLSGQVNYSTLSNRNYTKTGAIIHCEWFNSVLIDDEGQPQSILSLVLDVTERKRQEAALRDSEARYRLVADNSSDLIGLHDLEGNFLYVSPSCQALLGYTPQELLGTNPYPRFHPDDRERIRLQGHNPLLQGESTSAVYRMQRKSGDYIWLETLSRPILDETGQVVQMQTASRDVTKRIAMEAQLRHQALYDQLTQLPNRTLFMERVSYALQQSCDTEDDHIFAVLVIDLDRFKVVNDSLGPTAGDQLLVLVAETLMGCLRPIDTLARLGGDEFGLLLPHLEDLTDAITMAEAIQKQLLQPFRLGHQDVGVTASVGIAWASDHYETGAELVRDADIAMYRAKANGPGRYEIFDRAMHGHILQQLQIENDLRQALQRQELRVHYQPIIALASGRLVGFEALVRWQHASQGMITPDVFIPIAEESGLIHSLGEWVLRTVCQQLHQWQPPSPPTTPSLYCTVNVATQQLHQASFMAQLDAILAETQVPGYSLQLEITEGALLQDTAAVEQRLRSLQDRHISIVIDDFGTGYSSLSYLQRFPIDTLKIDKSFIGQLQPQLTERSEPMAIVRAILSLANTMGISVVAEGVETPYQLNMLRQLGCDMAQGYLLAPPLPLEEATALLQANPQW